MIRGIGVDIIEIGRIGAIIEEQGERFLAKVFTPAEILYCSSKHRPAQHFAARFAAKEATSKALATGWAGDFRWKEVELTNEPSGQPRLAFHGPLAGRLGRAIAHVSLSHSESHVVATVIIEEPSP
jgi:holo-[acyl-carrier protein] synthase